jgi:hypothetical protein
MQSSTFPGFNSEEASGEPASTPARPAPRQRKQDDRIEIDRLSAALAEMRSEQNRILPEILSRLADLECAAGRVEAAFGQLSGLQAIVQGRSNFRQRGGQRPPNGPGSERAPRDVRRNY